MSSSSIGMEPSDQDVKYAVCGGGTGGHIFPALAVVKAVKKILPQSKFYYFGKVDGMEAQLVPKEELVFYGLDMTGLSRSLSVKNIRTIWKAGLAYRKSRKILKKLKVKAILGTGGFVCGPVIAAAASLGIPSVIHESNAVPGLTNRLLGGVVTKVAISQTNTANYFDEKKVIHTGFPLRPGLAIRNKDAAYHHFGLDRHKQTIFVFPGSLAARKINKAMIELLPDLNKQLPNHQLLWMTGKADYRLVKKACDQISLQVSLHEFIEKVAEAYAITDLIIARAGAGTIAEISATGKPALLIPYPYATGDHQTMNARVLQQAGMAQMLKDNELNGPHLLAQIKKMIPKLKNYRAYGQVWKGNYPKHAAQDLAKLLITLGENK